MVYQEHVNTCVIRTSERTMEWGSAEGEYAASKINLCEYILSIRFCYNLVGMVKKGIQITGVNSLFYGLIRQCDVFSVQIWIQSTRKCSRYQFTRYSRCSMRSTAAEPIQMLSSSTINQYNGN